MSLPIIGASRRYTVISTVTAAAASHSLCTVSQVRSELGLIEGDRERDAILTRLIGEVSSAIENFCNRIFVKETIKDVFYPKREGYYPMTIDGIEPLALSRYPIVSIASVVEDTTTMVVNTDYVSDASRGFLIRLDTNLYPRIWPAVPITVTYDAGYNSIPADVVGATIRGVSQRWFNRKRDPALRSENVPGVFSAAYWVNQPGVSDESNLSPEVISMIDNYRVPVVR